MLCWKMIKKKNTFGMCFIPSLSLSLSCASGMSAQLLRPEPTWMGLLRFTRCLSSRNVRPISPFMASKTPNERIVPFPVAILSWYCNYIYNSHAWTPKALPTSRCGSTLLAARIDHCSWATRFLSRALCLAMSHAASKLLMRAARIIQLQTRRAFFKYLASGASWINRFRVSSSA